MTEPSPDPRRGPALAVALAIGFAVSAVFTFTSPSAAEEPTPAADPGGALVSRIVEAPPQPSLSEPPKPKEPQEPTQSSDTDTDTDPDPQEQPRRVTLEPRSGRPGTEVLVAGAGFFCEPPRGDGRDPVVVQWSGLDSFEMADPDFDSGRFTAELTVPADVTGTIEATVRCLGDDSTYRETFTVEPEPDVSTPSSDPVTSDPTIPPTPRPSTPTSPATPSTPDRPPTAPTSSPTPSPSPTPSASSAPPAAPAPGALPPPPSTRPAPSLSPVAERVGVPPIAKSEFLPTFDQLSLTLPIMVLAAALAALLIILVAFPADIFNKTYENCREEIHRFLHLHRLGKLLSLPPWAQGVLLAVAAVSLGMLLSRDEGPAAVTTGGAKGNLIAQTVALAVAAPLVMAAYTTPGELYLRRFRRAMMTVPLPALFFAVLCGLLSSVLELEPGYTFGLFAMFFLLRGQKQPSEAGKGRAVLLSALCLAALVVAGYAGFTVMSPAAHSGAAGWAAVVFDAICYWVVVLGAESLIFALLPMRFLDGRTLAGWSLWLWTILQFGAGWFFWMVLQLKVHANAEKFDADEIHDSDVLRAVLFFVIFGALSLAFWGWFRWPGRPTRKPGDDDSPPLAELFRPRVAVRRYRYEVVLAWRFLRDTKWAESLRRVQDYARSKSLPILAEVSESLGRTVISAAAAMRDAAARSQDRLGPPRPE